ncbi:MAG: HNH endonuclease [Planctomycetes bacterium]|nr:HNH endonuclease [Planctomycetota bacterium]
MVTHWLEPLGLALNPSKTRITHTLHPQDGTVGFDFLGFTVRQFPVGRTHTGRNTVGQPLGFKTIIRPSRAAQQRHLAALARIIRQSRGDTQAVLIRRLTPAIRGWATYYRHVVAARVFHRADDQVYYKLRRWAHRRHHNKRERWIISRYWRTRGARRWVFTPDDGPELARHTDVKVTRYAKVHGARSPFNGEWTYWSSRLGTYPGVLPSQARLLRHQGGRCTGCGLYVRPGDLLETDHVVPRSRGGDHTSSNKQVLHAHCHDAKTATDGSHPAQRSEVPTTAKAPRSRVRGNPHARF